MIHGRCQYASSGSPCPLAHALTVSSRPYQGAMHARAMWAELGCASGCRAELDAVAVLGSMQPHILDYQPVNDNYLQVALCPSIMTCVTRQQQPTAIVSIMYTYAT